jgi:VWFA-related protein
MGMNRWASFLLFGIASIGMAQQSATPAAPGLSHRPTANAQTPEGRIKLDVVVTDSAGRAVGGLQQQDFTLFDDKKPQPIVSFQAVDGSTGNGTADDPPVEVILLIDMANNRLGNVAYERFQLDKFLKQNGGKLAQPVSLMVFSDQGVKAQPRPSTDGNLLANSLANVESSIHTIPMTGGYDAIERMQLSLNTLRMIVQAEAAKPGRKLLLWIGPGWPMLENPGYTDSDAVRRSRFNVIVDLTQQLREARMTIYNINALDPGSRGVMRVDYYKNFLKAATSPNRVDSGAVSVPVFAVHTGGRVFDASGDLPTLINECVADAKFYYTLGFNPSAADHTDEYHDLALKVDKPGMTARTNTGYYAEPSLKP